MNTPLLWFANRGTGIVVMVLLSLTALLGLLATRGGAGRGLPRFVAQSVHRNLSLLVMALLAAHAATAVLDSYVDISWWQAMVPLGGVYKPFFLALGALALDLMTVVVVTSLVRDRLRHRHWRLLHVSAYPAWAIAVLHGFGIGSDSGTSLVRWLTVGCVTTVAGAATVRGFAVALEARRATQPAPVPLEDPESWDVHR